VFDVAELRAALVAVADAEKAPAMTAYMKDRFPFLGVTTPERRVAAKAFVAAGRTATTAELLGIADELWALPEREYQYVACDVLHRWVAVLDAPSLLRIEPLIRTKSWWDTVDALAVNVVGPIVRAHRELAATMDRWIDDDDMWIARTAILHQLKYRNDTDTTRLFAYIDGRAADSEFFIRKACGWALREYARTNPEAVRNYVDTRRDRLSGLTIREATKHL
jgi:3-methyladenine DNA glycosylase AlkD